MLLDKYLPPIPERPAAPADQDPADQGPAQPETQPLFEVCFGVPPVLAADTYALHQTLELTIGTREQTRYLYTVERDGDRAVCVVRSPALPPHLLEKAVPVAVPDAGQEAVFHVHATLTMKHAGGKRRPVRRENSAARVAWLDRHAAAGGFRVVESVNSTAQRWITRKGRRFWLDDTLFAGRLVVTDRAAFARTLAVGLGHGRAWGFGLLRIAPA
ncbi:type I-E CRISPR-associated protein Cas6/Cse3/CasE [Skermanella sp. TT6]|uniref:Type I-E CRISPR-associated protein Cas6/Cse3/CasE n=1 Tax=Skermanella cutis TaxID=2775420 RepID=A0ABX7B983_9PROT|nr:type I-E CRISPR-associated protein Cas6/Cse3/CasE [Skermanella sp. TT6]QQP90747.1 type I-E CRISPR-associated protein Cas6/Cse3/CasE [Skermanella sp. TT6]